MQKADSRQQQTAGTRHTASSSRKREPESITEVRREQNETAERIADSGYQTTDSRQTFARTERPSATSRLSHRDEANADLPS
jgi:hypothetical protein